MKREVGSPKTTERARRQAANGVADPDPNQHATMTVPPPTELLSVVQAAQTIISKVLALCAKQSSPAKATSELQGIPRYIDEIRVAEITGMSRVWLQRARQEGIGPRSHKIARRVAYRLDDVVHWIESGASAREHLSSRPRTKKSRLPEK